jgi:dual specificity phosphatase 12
MDRKSYDKERLRERVTALGLEDSHLFVDLKDSKDVKIQQFFNEVHEFIDKAIDNKENVLVHCKGGMSRSASMLCSYLMRKFSLSFDEAYKILKERRPIVDINEGFQNELRDYQKQLQKK